METTIEEFKKLSKPNMVVKIIETMVRDGWDIASFVYNFKAYKKNELISNYERLLHYHNENN